MLTCAEGTEGSLNIQVSRLDVAAVRETIAFYSSVLSKVLWPFREGQYHTPGPIGGFLHQAWFSVALEMEER